ncbi:ABC transporter permease [Nakamurella lactea]|uniref:ABC transporter permease n=1 Tax=Nakamurella lactea TaxID=459515 RepID=UPI0004084154|nr:ABC transporter permease [Nakamurella lactea]
MTQPAPTFPDGIFRPDPRPASAARMVLAAASTELRIQLRNGEQLLLAVVIPLGVLLGLTLTTVIDLDEPRIDTVTPGVLTLAVLSSAFTAQAIATGFDRRYGVLKRLAATGMSRSLLIAGKCGSVLAVACGQVLLIGVVAAILGWHPAGSWPFAIPLLLLGVIAMVGLALLIGGTLRAEAVLALANLIWLVLVGIGGVIVPLSSAPGWLRTVGGLTPVGALSDGLHAALNSDVVPSARVWLVLIVWTLAAWAATVRWFKWQ